MVRDQSGDLLADFKTSMRHVAASTFIVATRDSGMACHGMAVTSAVSLSMEPPSMLVAVNRNASMHGPLVECGRFTLNLLTAGHSHLITAFSRSDLRDQRFTPAEWTFDEDGLPLLTGALATHVCDVVARHDHGTHSVFFGNVTRVVLPPKDGMIDPLVWQGGRQRHLSPAS